MVTRNLTKFDAIPADRRVVDESVVYLMGVILRTAPDDQSLEFFDHGTQILAASPIAFLKGRLGDLVTALNGNGQRLTSDQKRSMRLMGTPFSDNRIGLPQALVMRLW